MTVVVTISCPLAFSSFSIEFISYSRGGTNSAGRALGAGCAEEGRDASVVVAA